MKAAPTFHRTLLCVAIVAIVALMLASLGCVSDTIARTVLPDDVIAVRMWENESARRRNQMMAEFAGRTREPEQLGVMDLGRFSFPWRTRDDRAPTSRYPGRLALINPRTLAVTFPDQAPLGARPLSWSADRKRLMFTSNRWRGRFQIYELNLATGEIKALAGGKGNVLAAAYAPDAGFAYGVIRLDADGEVETNIIKSEPRMRDRVLAERVAVRHIAYSPDGRYLAFTPQTIETMASSRGGLPRLVVQATETGGTRKELVPGLHPVFSPDGEWIVYTASRGDQLQTYRVRIDGSGRTAVGTGVRDEETPAISPDGKFVAYVSAHNGLKRLFVKRFDGTGDRLLYDGAAVEWPVW